MNVWDQKPAAVEPLPQSIRIQIQENVPRASATIRDMLRDKSGILEEENAPVIRHVSLNSEQDLPADLRHCIELPFLGKNTTWGQDNDESEAVLVTYPPPPQQQPDDVDSLLVRFGSGCEAYMDYRDDEGVGDDPGDVGT